MSQTKKATSNRKSAVKKTEKPAAKQVPVITPEEEKEGVVLVKETMDNILRTGVKLSNDVEKTIKRAELKASEPVGRHSKNFLAEVKALESFTDGMMFDLFKQFGYSVEWKRGEVRQIPLWLLQRCIQSGGEFEVLNG